MRLLLKDFIQTDNKGRRKYSNLIILVGILLVLCCCFASIKEVSALERRSIVTEQNYDASLTAVEAVPAVITNRPLHVTRESSEDSKETFRQEEKLQAHDQLHHIADADKNDQSNQRATESTSAQSVNSPMRDLTLSFLMILGSEIGDKTFLIAAVLAMRQPRLLIFTAAMTAMIVMSVLSALLGHVLPNLLPRRAVDLGTGILFLIFGVMMLREGWDMEADEQQKELEEVRAELEEGEWNNDDTKKTLDMESGDSHSKLKTTGKSELHIVARRLLSPVFVQTFILVFLAEWGDRSQFATIAMAAAQDVTLTIIGTIAGHSVCTGIAVVGGRFLAQRISVRTVTIAGAALFCLFGLIYIVTNSNID